MKKLKTEVAAYIQICRSILLFVTVIILTRCFCEKKISEIPVQDNSVVVSSVQNTHNNDIIEPEPQPNLIIGSILESLETIVPAESTTTLTETPVQLPAPSNMALIPSGTFQMGNENGNRDESPVHTVTVKAFYIGKYEVNQKEYTAIMGKNLSGFKGDNLPVENVSWYDAVEYCNRLSVKEGLQPAYHGEKDDISCDFTASGYRLPTEAEWEYAAYGFRKFEYSGSETADTVGWYNANSGGVTHDTGTKIANGMGLFDMSGNVAEWCWDWYVPYNINNQNNPSDILVSRTRVVRGGGWGNNGWNLRITARSHHAPATQNSSVGFRVARSALKGDN
jgi:formylglycine-generating enzyme required for sulfatase activity